MNARVLYTLATLVLFVTALTIAWFIRRLIVAHQESRLAGWEQMTMNEKLERLRVMKDVQIRDGARRWATGFVAITMFVWFMPTSLFWIGNVAEDAADTSTRAAELAERQEDDRVNTDLNLCRGGNAAREEGRRGRLQDVAAISRFLLRMGVEQDQVDQLAADRIDAIPPAEDTDQDCDGDGVPASPGDYPSD